MADSNIKINITADDNASKKLKDLDNQVGKTEGGMGNLGKAAAVGGAALVALGVKSVMAFEDLGLTVGKFADATGATTEEASRLIEVSGDLGISSDLLQSSIGKMSKQLGANEEAFKSYGIEVAKNADGTTNVNETFLNSVDAINAIQDPLKKAEASAKVFGKGYQGMAELLGKSSDDIRTSLASVSDAKVFDDKKVKDARDMRDAFDSIVDAGQDLMLTIGKSLAPVITKLAPVLVKVVEAAAPAAEALGEVLVSALEVVGPIIEALIPVITELAKAIQLLADVLGLFKPTGFTKAIEEAGLSLDGLKQKALDAGLSQEQWQEIIDESATHMAKTGDAQKDLTTVIETATGRLDELTTSTSETDRETRKLGDTQAVAEEAAEDLKDAMAEATRKSDAFAASIQHQIDKLAELYPKEYDAVTAKYDYADAQAEAMVAVDELNTTLDDHKATQEDVTSATRNARDAILEQSEKYATLDGAALGSEGAIKRQIESLKAQASSLAPGSQLRLFLEQYIADLERIPSNVSTIMKLSISSDATNVNAPGYLPRGGIAHGAEGGIIKAKPGGQLLVAGEAGSNEALIPLDGKHGMGGNTTVNLTVNAGLGTNGYEVSKVIVNSLAEYDRRNGTNIVTPAGR